MTAVRFRFRNRPALGAREARAVVGLLKSRTTPRSLKLAAKILDLVEAKGEPIAELALTRAEMRELLAVLNEHASERRFATDEVYRLRAELEGALNRT